MVHLSRPDIFSKYNYLTTNFVFGDIALRQADFGGSVVVNLDDTVASLRSQRRRDGEQDAAIDQGVYLLEQAFAVVDVLRPLVERIAPGTACRIDAVLLDQADVVVIDVHPPVGHADVADAVRP